MTTTLSNRQYPMLREFLGGSYMSIATAQRFDQRPFRSMLIRKWISYVPGRGFHITAEGRMAWEMFEHTDIARKNPHSPLTSYFDPRAFGVHLVSSKKKHTAQRKRRAA